MDSARRRRASPGPYGGSHPSEERAPASRRCTATLLGTQPLERHGRLWARTPHPHRAPISNHLRLRRQSDGPARRRWSPEDHAGTLGAPISPPIESRDTVDQSIGSRPACAQAPPAAAAKAPRTPNAGIQMIIMATLDSHLGAASYSRLMSRRRRYPGTGPVVIADGKPLGYDRQIGTDLHPVAAGIDLWRNAGQVVVNTPGCQQHCLVILDRYRHGTRHAGIGHDASRNAVGQQSKREDRP